MVPCVAAAIVVITAQAVKDAFRQTEPLFNKSSQVTSIEALVPAQVRGCHAAMRERLRLWLLLLPQFLHARVVAWRSATAGSHLAMHKGQATQERARARVSARSRNACQGTRRGWWRWLLPLLWRGRWRWLWSWHRQRTAPLARVHLACLFLC